MKSYIIAYIFFLLLLWILPHLIKAETLISSDSNLDADSSEIEVSLPISSNGYDYLTLANTLISAFTAIMIGRIYNKDFNFTSDCCGKKISVRGHLESHPKNVSLDEDDK